MMSRRGSIETRCTRRFSMSTGSCKKISVLHRLLLVSLTSLAVIEAVEKAAMTGVAPGGEGGDHRRTRADFTAALGKAAAIARAGVDNGRERGPLEAGTGSVGGQSRQHDSYEDDNSDHHHHHHHHHRHHAQSDDEPTEEGSRVNVHAPVEVERARPLDVARGGERHASFAKKLSGAVSSMHLQQRLSETLARNVSHRTPIVLLHGLNEEASSLTVLSRWIRYAMPGVYVYILELGDRYDTYFTNMNRQVAAACDVLARNPRLSHGFHMVAFSHGALLGRGYIERCNTPPVRAYVSMGGPQAGVFQVPAIHDEHADFILQGGAYEEWSQEYLTPAQYFKHPMKPNLHLQESIFLADINNERPVKNLTYKEHIASLDAMVLVKFSRDEVIVPKESSWFGYFAPFSVDDIIAMEKTELYTDDHIGIRQLDAHGRLHLVECEGSHQEFSRGWFYKNVIPFLDTTEDGQVAPSRVTHEEL